MPLPYSRRSGTPGRLGLERVDLLHLHNLIGRVGDERPLGVARVLEAVVPAVRRLQEQGKVRFFGVTASGAESR